MSLKDMLGGNWFTRLVLISWIMSAISVFVMFKNMELIVHGQLYYYGLRFSPDWADPYRIYTWAIYLSLGLPMALSSIALVSSFFKVEKVPEKNSVAPQRLKPPQAVAKAEPQRIVREEPKRVENGNGDSNNGKISCPRCQKTFSKALVMLDFRGGKNQLVSVCPYCNHVLGIASDGKGTEEDFHVAMPDQKAMH
jgi:hypothetical protein